jgi:hypothetical protein
MDVNSFIQLKDKVTQKAQENGFQNKYDRIMNNYHRYLEMKEKIYGKQETTEAQPGGYCRYKYQGGFRYGQQSGM